MEKLKFNLDDTCVKLREKINFLGLAQEMMKEKHKYNDEFVDYLNFIEDMILQITGFQTEIMNNIMEGNRTITRNYDKAIKEYQEITKELLDNYKYLRSSYENTSKRLGFFLNHNKNKKHKLTKTERLVNLLENMEQGEYSKETIAGLIGVNRTNLSKYTRRIDYLEGELYKTTRHSIIVL